jgi:membrane peptidoglycan carboxypeptidase
MVEAVWGRLLHGRRARGDPSRGRRIFSRVVRALRWLAAAAVLVLLGWGVATEARTSYLQSRLFTWFDSHIRYWAAPGPGPSIRFPQPGPYDVRLGYAELPAIIRSLEAHQFRIVRQARWSPWLDWFVANGGYTLYDQKMRAGLQLFDRRGVPLFKASYPQRIYDQFSEIPPVVANSLMFIEDRYLLDAQDPYRDPAVEWNRFMLAAAGRIAGLFNRHWRRGGASTLATQTVKFRDSPGGRTETIGEKLRQMLTAAADAYRGGPDTMAARRRILKAYLDSTPLASRPGYGEVIGVPEALWIWYGTDFTEANRVLTEPAATPQALARKGEIYRQALSLILAGRRPAYYLVQNRTALEALIDYYLRELANAGVISPRLRDAALDSRLHFRPDLPPPPRFSFVGNKATDWLQAELLSLLRVQSLWSLDRFDLKVTSSIDEAAQQRVTDVLARLGEPAYDRSLGLVGKQLLGGGNPALVNWSFVLYERGADANYVRIHADSLNEPFDINSGAKLQLGSTAKLRTLITYLDIMTRLHGRFALLPPQQLRAVAAKAGDPLTRWAADYMAGTRDRSLKPMLEAAMMRRYSAAPATFFTGGGENSFANFEKSENHEVPTVEAAFEHSINAAFIRILKDIRDFYIARLGIDEKELLSNPDDPAREAYLKHFVEREGRVYLYRFWKDYRGLSPKEALDELASRTRPAASHLAVIFLAIHPGASKEALTAFLRQHMPQSLFSELSDDRLWDLYRDYMPGKFSLNDEGYIAGVHPLEIWLVSYLQKHPAADWHEIVKASGNAIQQSYVWLFKPNKTVQQNVRIKTLLEQEAFDQIWQDWRRQGYPFDHLVPSLGTAIGASGDRPDALASLMGIIMNDGVRRKTVDLQRLEFADGTPYQTDFAVKPKPRRMFPAVEAQVVRRALLGVVLNGTGMRVRGTYRTADGSPMPVGGKTGTGDNRYHIYGRGGYLRGERVVDRTATFVFFLGDRFFGTVTAYVPGPPAARFTFSSAMAVQLLKALKPELDPLLHAPIEGRPPKPIAEIAPPSREYGAAPGNEYPDAAAPAAYVRSEAASSEREWPQHRSQWHPEWPRRHWSDPEEAPASPWPPSADTPRYPAEDPRYDSDRAQRQEQPPAWQEQEPQGPPAWQGPSWQNP